MTLTQFVFLALGLIFCFGDAAAPERWARPGGRRFRLVRGMLPGAVVLAAVGLKVFTKLLLWIHHQYGA